jgi:DNA-binding transcriptional regulator GbsR (MarR family)
MARASPLAAIIMPEIAYAFGMSTTNVSRALSEFENGFEL